ncbi:hypothetical protein KSS87_011506 [Heliosperma pusillum]|nr:hypothetical protein KSS87_011506 [Heliosperma pusillum]
MNSRPAIGPAVVDKQQREAFNNCSPSLTLKIPLNTLSAPDLSFPLTVIYNGANMSTNSAGPSSLGRVIKNAD